ncbi:hypothetical protein APUTEX25_002244, partial [Auxenochlorella protothecoides]
ELTPRNDSMPNVLVYEGPGAGPRSVLSALESLRLALKPSVQVRSMASQELLAGRWRQDCLALVMPGGADTPYCQVLNGHGNQLITGFVAEQGGAYLGLCAGAYYASARIEFEPGSSLEVAGQRELAFFPGTARGSVVPGFDYRSEAGAAAVPLSVAGEVATECRDYSNGGPAFHPDAGALPPGCRALARYADLAGTPLAALACAVGAGRAVLCGTHPELAPHWLGPPESAAVPAQAGVPPLTGGGDQARALQLQRALGRHGAARWDLWLLLLEAAGLGAWLAVQQGGPPPEGWAEGGHI